MLCYTHPNQQANAICKNCNKAVCTLCAIELEDGIACSAHCAEKVNTINALINRTKRLQGRTKGAYYRGAFIYTAMAALFILCAFIYPDMKLYGLAAGGIFLLAGGLTIISGNKLK